MSSARADMKRSDLLELQIKAEASSDWVSTTQPHLCLFQDVHLTSAAPRPTQTEAAGGCGATETAFNGGTANQGLSFFGSSSGRLEKSVGVETLTPAAVDER